MNEFNMKIKKSRKDFTNYDMKNSENFLLNIKCCKCNKQAEYFRKHEGNAYCNACICRQIERAFKHNIRESGLKKGDKIFVKDGGAKNVLLYLLKNQLSFMNFKIGKGKAIEPATLDDRIENFLRNFLFEKYNKKFAKRILPKSNIKPFGNVLKDEIILYAKINGIRFSDIYNKKNSKNFLLNKADKKILYIRKILQELEEKRPGTKSAISRYVDKINC